MKRIIIASLVIIVLVGACTVTLLINRKKIEEKTKLEGNLKSIPVFVSEIKSRKITGNFSASGTFYPAHELLLMSEGQGKVVNLLFNTGDFVKQGQVLIKLDDEMIRSTYELALSARDKSRKDLQKFEELVKADAASAQQVEDMRLALQKAETDLVTAKKQLDNAAIKAPIQGTITKKLVETGSLVMPGTPVAEIVDVSRLKFIANVSEAQVVKIHNGMNLTISSALFPGIEYKGTVTAVNVKADDAKRFAVEIELVNNPKYQLKAGMFGTALFGFDAEYESLTIPRMAIVGSIRTPKVYVIENGKAILKDIRIGNATDNEVEAVEGLVAGDRVVTSGQINLDNNSLVTIVNK
ncbi:MAG: efflux RND transporter periplasmic adaptor subunit [Syntrophothermus sp.]